MPSNTALPNWDTTSASDGAGSGAAAVVVAGSDGGGVSRARKHAVSEGTKAVTKFESASSN